MDLPIIYPMNAKSDDKRLKEWWDSEEVVAEEKYDGSRYLMYITPDGSRFFSRRKSDVTGKPVEKTGNLPHLKKFYSKELIILDGEIIAGENQTSNEVTSIMGSLPERAIDLQEKRGYVNYVVFDILYYYNKNVMGSRWYLRRKILDNLLNDFNNSYINPSRFVVDNKKRFYEEIVENGGEGVILKNRNGIYVPDKRPVGNWIKVKKYETFDVVITGYDAPEKVYTGKNIENWPYWEDSAGNIYYSKKEAENSSFTFYPVTKYYALGWIGAVKFGMYINGKLTEIGQTSGMDEHVRRVLSEDPDNFIGQVIEVGAMEMVKKTHALRHPRFICFRPDRNAESCVLTKDN